MPSGYSRVRRFTSPTPGRMDRSLASNRRDLDSAHSALPSAMVPQKCQTKITEKQGSSARCLIFRQVDIRVGFRGVCVVTFLVPSDKRTAVGESRLSGEATMTDASGHAEGADMKQEVFLPEDYRPAEDEPFMNDRQLEYFRRKLLNWKSELLAGSRDTIEGLQGNTRNIPDVADRASEETDRALELRTRDRQRKLVAKIEAALRRIDEGEYGYCEVTGDPISLKRLDARPIATMTLEAQERHERREKVHRDD